MKLLVIGGTAFVGRHIVESALRRNHQVTLFHRGKSNPHIFPDVEKILGDRNIDLSKLNGRGWDAVVDTCGYTPEQVEASSRLLSGAAQFSAFVSSLSVYADFNSDSINENYKVYEPVTGDLTVETYGPHKVQCERIVEKYFPRRSLIVRAGLLVGPYDYMNRLTYWISRIARGGEVLAPGIPNRKLQIIDMRDVADWMIRMIESAKFGTFNATGPDYELTFGNLLETCKTVTNSDASLVWVDDEFLLQHKVQPFADLPYWVPGENHGFYNIDITRALASGLTYRPLADTISDTMLAARERQDYKPPFDLPPGLSSEREAEILKLFQRRDRGAS